LVTYRRYSADTAAIVSVERHRQNRRSARERTMGQTKIGGIVLIVVGLGLAYWGYDESSSLGSSLNEAFSGSPSDNVMLKYIGGAASIAVGAFFFTRK
jgi:hypothetical protein